jgi:hypothetical protein
MTSRRKPPSQQCSIRIHKSHSQSRITVDDNDDNIGTKIQSISTDANATAKSLKSESKSNNRSSISVSPTSTVADDAIDINMNSCSSLPSVGVGRRNISPMKKSSVRRVHSFDDSFSNSPVTPRTSNNRKETYKRRCHSLPTKTKKNVQFNEKPDIFEIECVSDIPSDIIIDLWWSVDEYTDIKREYEAMLYLLEQKISIDEQYDSARGLHKHTEHGAWDMFEKQRNARNAVLHQQDINKRLRINRTKNSDKGENDTNDLAIAQAYMKETIPLRDNAIQEAQIDYHFAMEYLNATTDGNTTNDESISDLSIFQDTGTSTDQAKQMSPPSHPVNTHHKKRSCFHDLMVNRTDRQTKVKPPRSKSMQPLSRPINDENDASFYINDKLSSVMEDSMLIMSDEDDDGEDDLNSDDDTIPKGSDSSGKVERSCQDHVATKVRFAKKTQKIKRTKVKDIEKDTKRRWYSKAELIEIATTVNNMVEMIEHERHIVDNENLLETKYNETRRGLEKSTELGAQKLYERRRDALYTVLLLQSKQRETNFIDPIALANAYINATIEANQEAEKFGKQDAKEARKYRIKRRSMTDVVVSTKAAVDSPSKASSDEAKRGRRFSEEEKEPRASKDISISPPRDRDQSDDTDLCDYSHRSILNLNTDGLNDTTTTTTVTSSTELLGHDIDRINNVHHVSESHAPSRRCLLTTVNIFDRQQKIRELKQNKLYCKKRNIMTSAARNRTASAEPLNLYDPSTNDDESTTQDGSIGAEFETLTQEDSILSNISQEGSYEFSEYQIQEVSTTFESTKNRLVHSQQANKQEKSYGANTNETETISMSIDCIVEPKIINNNKSSVVWFKVSSSDIQEIMAESGETTYVLKNAIKYNNHP